MTNKHDAILIPLIAIIIMIQLIVFLFNLRKISRYKKAIGNVRNFKIVHATVQESDISEISINEIFRNNIESKHSIYHEEEILAPTNSDVEIQDTDISEGEFNFPKNDE